MVITSDKWGGEVRETKWCHASSGNTDHAWAVGKQTFQLTQQMAQTEKKKAPCGVFNTGPERCLRCLILNNSGGFVPSVCVDIYCIYVITVFPLLYKLSYIHVWLHSNQKGCVKFTFLQRDCGTYFRGFELWQLTHRNNTSKCLTLLTMHEMHRLRTAPTTRGWMGFSLSAKKGCCTMF